MGLLKQKRNYIKMIVLLLSIVTYYGCDKNDGESKNDGSNDPGKNIYYSNLAYDAITGPTPGGGKLKAAVDGPVRSALGEPKIDTDTFTLKISGEVETPVSFSWDDINNFDAYYTDTIMMYCVEGWEVWGNWKGILLKDLLDSANVKQGSKYVYFVCADGYSSALPLNYLMNYNSMLAYEVNGAPLQNHDGFPLRLVAFGKFGYKWAKWITGLEVIDSIKLGYWEQNGYPDEANVPLERRKYYERDNAKPLEY